MSLASPPTIPLDRRQSATALTIARGTQRLLLALGLSCVAEMPLMSGRRADLVALGGDGEIWIVEIKSSVEDFRAIRNGAIIGCIATACFLRPPRTFRLISSRRMPGSFSPMATARNSFAKRRSTGCMPGPAKASRSLSRGPRRCACRRPAIRRAPTPSSFSPPCGFEVTQPLSA